MKNLAYAFTGVSNSGKTTLIKRLALHLRGRFKVAIIKHDPKDKARFDTDGKDSSIFYEAGADVAVVSDVKATIMFQHTRTIKRIAEEFGEVDYLFVEGLKEIPLPRLAIMRGEIQEWLFPHVQAVAIDESIDPLQIPRGIATLNLNDTEEILAWIDAHALPIREIR